MLQEIPADMQKLLSDYVFGNLQIFSINAKGFGSKVKALRGRDIKRNHLDEIEKEHAKTKRKKLTSLSRNSHLKRMFLERFDKHLPHF